MRLDYPAHLGSDYRALDAYGARLRTRIGQGFRRNLRFNDDDMGLYMDVYLPKQKQWVRVDMDLVKEDNAGRAAKIRNAVNKKDLRTGNSDSEEDNIS